MTTHKVQKGETLSAIAARYGVSVDEIANANNIKNKNLIRTGQILNIPTKNYKELGQALENCLTAIEKLSEYRALMKLL